jgi:hypothetical protein
MFYSSEVEVSFNNDLLYKSQTINLDYRSIDETALRLRSGKLRTSHFVFRTLHFTELLSYPHSSPLLHLSDQQHEAPLQSFQW